MTARRRLLAAGALTSAAAAGAVAAAAALGVRVGRPARPLTDRWRELPIEPRGSTRLGFSFRPLQAEALGLEPGAALAALLGLPFEMVRLAAYWNRIEPEPGAFDIADLDWQVDAAEAAGKQIVLAVGAVKAFGYPEVFIPGHRLSRPLAEGRLVDPASDTELFWAARAFVARVVERYRARPSIVAWQVEHEAVDPLGMEHSWRLSEAFVAGEIAAVRLADPTRPIVLNGFLPATLPVRLQQWWRTRDQGDSLDVAGRLADLAGIDYYPRHALLRAGPATLYLDGSRRRQAAAGANGLFAQARAGGLRLLIAEGQAEPWETSTTPPSRPDRAMYSGLPEHVIENYDAAMALARGAGVRFEAYLFWGAEYWLRRERDGDSRYLDAAARILAES